MQALKIKLSLDGQEEFFSISAIFRCKGNTYIKAPEISPSRQAVIIYLVINSIVIEVSIVETDAYRFDFEFGLQVDVDIVTTTTQVLKPIDKCQTQGSIGAAEVSLTNRSIE